ncbi:MAG: hypothetical protein EZS28_022402 [Streblomastix strix]|uniref:C2 domain-containing protein n=1 Tax=Streblomastix strix TaxID=222440 RepID=A0A5J4VHL4_9EUKA|nr:MAG: hypothetical protein EZS28_022402 [Streblomastix strix]
MVKLNTYTTNKEKDKEQRVNAREPNPFVRLLFAGKGAKSSRLLDVKDKILDETFGFEFNPSETEDRELTLELWDTDESGFDQRMGKIEIAIHTYLEDKQDVTMSVVAHDGDPEPIGTKVADLELTILYEISEQEKQDREVRHQQRLQLIDNQTGDVISDDAI